MSLLCRLGLHAWAEPGWIERKRQRGSGHRYRFAFRKCRRCGLLQRRDQ